MPSTELKPKKSLADWLSRLLHWLLAAVIFLGRFVLIAWPTLVIYYSHFLPWFWLRLLLASAFCAFAVWVFWYAHRPRMTLVFMGLFLIVLASYFFTRPSQYRNWRPDLAVLPRAIINGDNVRIINVRNIGYRTARLFTPRYEEREVQISHLTSIDFFVSYWMPTSVPVAHTFLSFNFDNAPPLCISIEARSQVGETFSPLASQFRYFELIYVVGDERDIVRLRTNFRDEKVFAYHLRVSPESARALFMIYLDRINQLADRPEFYNLLNSSCTINIVRYARAIGKPTRFDLRYILNGLADWYLYCKGFLDTSMSFRELRRRSLINGPAQAAGNSPNFSQQIRAAMPPLN